MPFATLRRIPRHDSDTLPVLIPSSLTLAKKKNFRGQSRSKPNSSAPGRSSTTVRVRQVSAGHAWELVHPRCALERADDLAEVHKILEAGEAEIAVDELRWLLNGCSDFIAAHRLLGETALAEGDLPLARAHFGYAVQIGSKALKQAGSPSPLPYAIEANQPFLEAGKGLIFCLKRLDKQNLAQEIVDLMLACDPTDPLAVKDLIGR